MTEQSATQTIEMIGKQARLAFAELARASTQTRQQALNNAAAALRMARGSILEANQKDVAAAREADLLPSKIDRLMLDESRLEAIASGVEAVAELADPVGQVTDQWERPNGLTIERVRTPLGVIGVIFESRPNVAADAAALCIKSGNAVILRGGRDSRHSKEAILLAIRQGLLQAGLPENIVQAVPSYDRALVGAMLQARGVIDVLVPRGGRSLTERVLNEARIPVFAHLEGVVQLYIHKAADPDKALNIAVNAKMRRTGICGASEALLIDQDIAPVLLPKIAQDLRDQGCILRGDEKSRALFSDMEVATADDWGREYLDAILAIKIVSGLDEAIDYIARYGSHHTDAIITEDQAAASRFLTEVDSAIVMHNASTQFADGGEFGMGAEIGIATGRMHARGPIGVEQLTCFKYQVHGTGQIRP